jgi:hypothetical protein
MWEGMLKSQKDGFLLEERTDFFGTTTLKDKDIVEGDVERWTKENDIADVSQHSLFNASEAQDGVMLTPPSLERDRYKAVGHSTTRMFTIYHPSRLSQWIWKRRCTRCHPPN